MGGTLETRLHNFLGIICHFQKYKVKVCRTNGSKDTANCLFWAKCQLGKDDLHQNTTLHLLWQVRVRVRAILLFVAEKIYRCLHNFLRRSAGPELYMICLGR